MTRPQLAVTVVAGVVGAVLLTIGMLNVMPTRPQSTPDGDQTPVAGAAPAVRPTASPSGSASPSQSGSAAPTSSASGTASPTGTGPTTEPSGDHSETGLPVTGADPTTTGLLLMAAGFAFASGLWVLWHTRRRAHR